MQQSKFELTYNVYEPEVFQGNRLKFMPVSKQLSLEQHESCETRTNITVTVKPDWTTEDIIGASRKVSENNSLKKSAIYK